MSDEFPPQQHTGPRRGLSERALARARAYLETHLGDNVTLDDVARVAAVSRFHFARSFRASTGESPMAYLRRLRIERAKELLRRSRSPITDIALLLGFYDQSHFTRHFIRHVGMTPGQFARREGAWDVLSTVRAASVSQARAIATGQPGRSCVSGHAARKFEESCHGPSYATSQAQ